MKNYPGSNLIDFCVLPDDLFSGPDEKNRCIAKGKSKWLLLARESLIKKCGKDIEQEERACIQENSALWEIVQNAFELEEADVYVFAKNTRGVLQGPEIMPCYDEAIDGLLIRRDFFVRTGCFHELLGAGCDIEFVCRAADQGKVVWLGETDHEPEEAGTDIPDISILRALAYLCCIYQTEGDAYPAFEGSLRKLMNRLQNMRIDSSPGAEPQSAKTPMEVFMSFLGEFVQDADLLWTFRKNTAPFYIVTGDDTAYGVLKDFALQLASALAQKGQAVITTDGSFVPYQGIEDIEGKPLKALVGFQAPVLFRDFFKQINAPKFQFWFDDPVFFPHLFDTIKGDDSFYLLCQDGYHAEHFRNHYHLKHALHFPPGGVDPKAATDISGRAKEGLPPDGPRDLEVVFIGTWRKAEKPKELSEEAEKYLAYMLSHPQLSYEQGAQNLFSELPEDQFMQLLWSLAPVYRYIRGVYRNGVIDALLEAGIQIHVYGDSWKCYEPGSAANENNLIRHPILSPKESNAVLQRAVISLNIMIWHKAGMTERIIGAMLNGTVCVSDGTAYLREHFTDDEMIRFELTPITDHEGPVREMDELVSSIKSVLSDHEKRQSITTAAYRHAVKQHTWEVRANQLLKLIRADEKANIEKSE